MTVVTIDGMDRLAEGTEAVSKVIRAKRGQILTA